MCAKGEFPVGVIGLDHGHINGMCNGLREAGADIVRVYDRDPAKVDVFRAAFPGYEPAASEEEILQDARLKLVASASSIPDNRCPLGLRVMEHGKDFFSDKPPLINHEQLAAARQACTQTGQEYAVYYSERIHVEAAVLAGKMIHEGRIGPGPPGGRPGPAPPTPRTGQDWFFDRGRFGGILVDIGCHQIEQFLFYSGATDARVVSSKTANYHSPQHPRFDDFGDATLVGTTVRPTTSG